jgi:hypothetical protein
MEVENGIEKGLATLICETTFKNSIAHLILEISKPIALEVVRDVKVTFPDMLGTVGMTHFICLYPQTCVALH